MPAADYISPQGEFIEKMFPGVNDVENHINVLLSRVPAGYTAAQAEAWVYVRGFSDAILRLAERPREYAEDGQSRIAYSTDLLTEARLRLATWQSTLDELTEAEAEPVALGHSFTTVRVKPRW